MFALIFIQFVFTLDEGLFNNGCLCSVTPGECTPYCACDPFCTDAEKDTFHFTIPQKLTENNVACDIKHRIKKFHSKSVSTFKAAIEGEQPTCYYYQPNYKNSNSIKSYSPKDFGLEGFADAIKLDDPGLIFIVEQLNEDVIIQQQTEEQNTDPTDGYLSGKPIKIIGNDYLFVNNDINMPILFGVDSNYVFNFNVSNEDDLNKAFNLTNREITIDSTQQGPIIYLSSSSIKDYHSNINVFWTFFYQKRGSSNEYRYIIRKIKSEYFGSSVPQNYTAHVNIKFIELSSDGESAFEAKEEKLYSYSIKQFFVSLLGRDEDSLKSSGVIFCIGFLWTMWAYYSFFFSTE